MGQSKLANENACEAFFHQLQEWISCSTWALISAWGQISPSFASFGMIRWQSGAPLSVDCRRESPAGHQLSRSEKKKPPALSWTRHEVTRGREKGAHCYGNVCLFWDELQKRSGSLMAPCPRGSPAKTRRLANQSQRALGEIMAAPPGRKQGFFFFFLNAP